MSGKEIDIDGQLDNIQASAGLYLLKLYLQKIKAQAQGAAEVLVISNSFRLPYEDGLKLKEDLNLNASLNEMQRYMESKERIGYPEGWPNTFFRQRERLEKSIQDFKTEHRIEMVACSPAADLPQMVCRMGLERLSQVLRLPYLHLPKIDRLGITSSDEMPVAADSFRDPKDGKTVLLVRSDFGIAPLFRFFNQMDGNPLEVQNDSLAAFTFQHAQCDGTRAE